MQKVVQRSERAHRVATRKLAKSVERRERDEAWSRAQNYNRLVRANGQRIVQSRINRKVDWEAGPLAPRRDVGEQAKSYGALSVYDLYLPDRHPVNRPRFFHISRGDRVVVLRGRERGRIGVVEDLNEEKASVEVKGINLVYVDVPRWMNSENDHGDAQSITTVARHLSIEDVKLVYPLPDPATGQLRDVIIDRLEVINAREKRRGRDASRGERVIAGTNTIIPWPEATDPHRERRESDTAAVDVDVQTFQPILLHPPMPMSVIDELRNKYSKFRTRHDWDYLEKKAQEDATAARRKDLIKEMRTPLKELAELRAEQKRQREKELTEDQLAKIGEIIAQERARGPSTLQQMDS